MSRKNRSRGKSKRKGRTKESPSRQGLLLRLIRLLFIAALLGCVLLFIGSFYIRNQVIAAVQNSAFTSSSVVVSRPLPLQIGSPFAALGVVDRLNRIGYQKVSDRPTVPGQYQSLQSGYALFVRKSILPDETEQNEELVQIGLNEFGEINSLHSVKYNQELSIVWIEPEIVSLLGTNAARASRNIALEGFPLQLREAILAIEDDNFYSHYGIDPLAILRALIANIRSGSVVQGGSTITQQLAKNLFFSSERTLVRKAYEAVAAVLLETAFDKETILQLYMNEVFLAQEGNIAIHGFAEAAESFFGREVADLTLAESATLAGMVKAPSSYSPRRFPERAASRRNVVLKRMEELGYISTADRKKAKNEKLHTIPAQRVKRLAPYYVDYIRQKLAAANPGRSLQDQQIRIHTGLDTEYQKCAQRAVQDGLKEIESARPALKRKKSPLQVGLISVSPSSGEIRAWVGGRDYGKSQFDHVYQAKRQPGSAFKPFVYLTALDRSLNNYRVARTTSLLVDEPMTLQLPGTDAWQPENYDRKFRGDVTVRYALSHSLNVPTVDLTMKIGVDAVARTAELFGFGRDLPKVPSLALGAGEVSPFEMARAYAAIANGGLLIDLRPIVAMAFAEEEPFYTAPLTEERAADEAATYILTDILRSVIESGTGYGVRRRGFNQPAAGKTGTSNDSRDSWFAGFTPSLLTIVWVGFDDNDKTSLTGATGALPIWTKYMQCVEPMEPDIDFVSPEDVVYRTIDAQTGLLLTDTCPRGNAVEEVFVRNTEPITPCPLHSRGSYNRDDSFHFDNQPRKRRQPTGPSLWEKLFGSDAW